MTLTFVTVQCSLTHLSPYDTDLCHTAHWSTSFSPYDTRLCHTCDPPLSLWHPPLPLWQQWHHHATEIIASLHWSCSCLPLIQKIWNIQKENQQSIHQSLALVIWHEFSSLSLSLPLFRPCLVAQIADDVWPPSRINTIHFLYLH